MPVDLLIDFNDLSADQSAQDDDWGEFESAQAINSFPPVAAFAKPSENGANSLKQDGPWILYSESLPQEPTKPTTAALFSSAPERTKKTVKLDDNILFDAEDLSDEAEDEAEDDFGDFESVSREVVDPIPASSQTFSLPSRLPNIIGVRTPSSMTSKEAGMASQTETLIDFDEEVVPVNRGVLRTTNESRNKQDVIPGRADATFIAADLLGDENSIAPDLSKTIQGSAFTRSRKLEQTHKPHEIPKNIQDEDIEAWDDFQDNPPTAPSVLQRISPLPDHSLAHKNSSSTNNASASFPPLPNLFSRPFTPPKSLPPSNIPPPSTLLSLFPSIFELIKTNFINPYAPPPASSSSPDALLTNDQTMTFLRDFCTIATVFAHIVGGRKLRWKRDTHLSQSMSIGAASTKTSGMKLTSLDRSVLLQEDREVGDVVRLWRTILGRLKAAVIATGHHMSQKQDADKEGNSSTAEGLVVPEITETAVVRTATVADGAVVTTTKACLVCGLKRQERLPRVDIGVVDAFGEYWVEFWGHRGCVQFWLEYSPNLKGR